MQTNPELHMAWQFIQNTGTHLFLTGKAGTGKTTFLKTLKEHSPKRMIVLAPTGIAAINAGGVTIHSFFQLPFSPFVPNTTFRSGNRQYRFGKEKINIIRSMDLLVIDEISMVRADLLDAVDDVLRRYRERDKPFGGVQMLMIGDMQQLAPVVRDDEWTLLQPYYDSPYFFSSNALKHTQYMTIELKTVYRQQDSRFLALLNKVRDNVADDHVLAELNKRYIPGFVPPENEDYIRLTTHNNQAQVINDSELAKIDAHSYSFKAEISGTFPEYSFPTDEVLTLKNNAQIMFVKNDISGEHRYYNGMIGEVVYVDSHEIRVKNKKDGETFALEPEEWSNAKYVLNKETQEITEEVEGVFKQYPIRLAWGITIHKSQGLTFEHVVIDAKYSFAHGQTYVALSRCKTLEGIVLSSPLRSSSIICDQKVEDFNSMASQSTPNESTLSELERSYALQLINELFSMQDVILAFDRVFRHIDDHFDRRYPKVLSEYKMKAPDLQTLLQLAKKFEKQYTSLIQKGNGDIGNETIQERIHAAAIYFSSQLDEFVSLANRTNLDTENKLLKRQMNERLTALKEALSFKKRILDYEGKEETTFSVSDYLHVKARILLGTTETEKEGKRKRKEKVEKIDTRQVSYDMFCKGMSIGEIASKRGFVSSTIISHLLPFIKMGKIDVTKLIDKYKFDEIKNYVASHPDKINSLMAIKENVDKNITYTDIKLTLASM